MTKLNDYKNAKEEHEQLVKILSKDNITIARGTIQHGEHHVTFCFRDDNAARTPLCQRRLADYLADACRELQDTIIMRAVALSQENVVKLRVDAETEAVEFLRSPKPQFEPLQIETGDRRCPTDTCY